MRIPKGFFADLPSYRQFWSYNLGPSVDFSLEDLRDGAKPPIANIEFVYMCCVDRLDPSPGLHFKGMRALTTAMYAQNRIIELADNMFADCGSLKAIQFQGNLIQTIPRKTFAFTGGLEELNLNGNLITRLDPRLFDDCTSLLTLNLGNNAIRQVPVVFLQSMAARPNADLVIEGNVLDCPATKTAATCKEADGDGVAPGCGVACRGCFEPAEGDVSYVPRLSVRTCTCAACTLSAVPRPRPTAL